MGREDPLAALLARALAAAPPGPVRTWLLALAAAPDSLAVEREPVAAGC